MEDGLVVFNNTSATWSVRKWKKRSKRQQLKNRDQLKVKTHFDVPSAVSLAMNNSIAYLNSANHVCRKCWFMTVFYKIHIVTTHYRLCNWYGSMKSSFLNEKHKCK